jgi:lysophospholipase L1-like esterase
MPTPGTARGPAGLALPFALALVAALTVGLAAADAAPGRTGFPPVRPTRVLVLGDSVIKGAVPALPAALPGREVVVDAEVSRSTGASADALDRLGTDWDIVVVLLAHNDGGSPAAYQPAYDRILQQLSGVRQVSVLTLHEVRPYYRDVNAHLRSLPAVHRNVRVADWNAVAAANPGALAGDGLHLNGEGARLMAELVSAEVRWAELAWGVDLRRLASSATTTTTAPPTTTTTAPPTTTTAPTTTTEPAPTTTIASDADERSGAEGAATERSGAEEEQASDEPTSEEQAADEQASDGFVPLVVLSAAAWVAVGAWGVRRIRRGRATSPPTDEPVSGTDAVS